MKNKLRNKRRGEKFFRSFSSSFSFCLPKKKKRSGKHTADESKGLSCKKQKLKPATRAIQKKVVLYFSTERKKDKHGKKKKRKPPSNTSPFQKRFFFFHSRWQQERKRNGRSFLRLARFFFPWLNPCTLVGHFPDNLFFLSITSTHSTSSCSFTHFSKRECTFL